MADEPRPSGELVRFTPEVKTLAKPQATPLIGARGVVHRSPTLKAAFQRAKAEGWTPERLAGAITPELEQALECEPEAAIEVAQYLADEYFQLGESVLVCDRTTGRAIARVADEDMYQPPDQRRPSGELVRPLPRLNPNLEGFLVSYIFEQQRDQQVRMELAQRLPRTSFMVPEIDPRLRAATRAGRVGIAQDVRAALPDVLEATQGSARAFLQRFRHIAVPPEGMDALPRRTAEARSRQNIVDPKAMNLRFSWEATLKARTGTSWVREMAAHLVNEAERQIRPDLRLTVAHPLLEEAHVEGAGFWVGDPDTLRAIQTAHPSGFLPPNLPCLPDHQGAVGFDENSHILPAGAVIVHPETYEFTTREIHGRWEMLARMEYTLYVDWNRLRFVRVTDIPIEAVAEIL